MARRQRFACCVDVSHIQCAVIYARRAESDYKRRHYGTCKVDRIGYDDTPFYCGPNFINLEDRYDQKDRSRFFVQVNTLVNN